jgi:phosphoglycerate kinase
MGVFEFDKFSGGSKAILEAVISATQGGTTTIIGGGDTATCAKRFGGVTKVGLYLHGHIFVFQFL